MKRPTINDDAIIATAAKLLAPKVAEWICDGGDQVDEEDEAQIEEDLSKAMRWHSDGYELAKSLDMYSPDAALVEVLDDAGSCKRKALDAALEAWVTTSGIQAPELESTVVWSKRADHGKGIITRNWPNGTSTVYFPDKGHVREGIGTHGAIVAWEELEKQ